MNRSEAENLLRVLIKMNLRSSDYRSVLGVIWSFMGPFLMFLVTYFIFRDRFGQQIPHFPLVLLTSIICLGFFQNVVNYSLRFLKSNRNILNNTRTPVWILYVSALFVPFLKFSIEIALCAILALVSGSMAFYQIPLLILTIPFFFLLATGIGLFFSILNALAGDVEEIWPIISRTLFFVTPTFYTLNMLSDWAREIVRYANPVTPFILIFQSIVSPVPVPYFSAVSTFQALAYAVICYTAGLFLFRKFQNQAIEKL